MFTGNIVRREATILQMTSNLYTDTEQLLQRWRYYAEESTVSASNAFRQLIAASRYRAPEQKPGAPILLLSSTNDGMI